MNFESLVTFFKDWSGRLDLDNETIVHYLNAGQKFLDDLTEYQQSPSRYIYAGTVGLSYLSLTAQAKVIERVDLITIADGTRNKVTEIALVDLMALDDQIPSYRESGIPCYFSRATARKVSGAVPSGASGKLAVVETGTAADKLGLLFDRPLDAAYTVDIYGKFYSSTIVEDIDPDTFWAIQYPFTLLHAALYKLEVNYRNTEGAKDWLASIQTDLAGIDRNVAEQTANEITEMRG